MAANGVADEVGGGVGTGGGGVDGGIGESDDVNGAGS